MHITTREHKIINMEGKDLYSLALEEGVLLSVNDNRLTYKTAKERISDDLKALLISNREKIINYISQLEPNSSKASKKPELVAIMSKKKVPLSFAQARLWYIDQIEEGSNQYNIVSAYEISGDLKKDKLIAAFQLIFARHEILRSVIVEKDGIPEQSVAHNHLFNLIEIDLSDELEKENKLKHIKQEERDRNFKLDRDVLFRALLVTMDKNKYAFILNIHHVLTDGWSMSLISKEFSEIYSAFVENRVPSLSLLELQYSDYAIWQENWLKGEVLEAQLDYWNTRLVGAPYEHSIPLDFSRSSQQTFNGSALKRTVNPQLTHKFHAFCKKYNTTSFIALQTIFSVLVAKLSDLNDIVLGTTVFGRDDPKLESIIGFFANTIVLRTEIANDDSFASLLERNKENILNDFVYQHVPFEKVIQRVNPVRRQNLAPLVQIMFAVNQVESNSVSIPGIVFKRESRERSTSKFEITMTVTDAPDNLLITLGYNKDLFTESRIELFCKYYILLIDECISRPDNLINAISLNSLSDFDRPYFNTSHLPDYCIPLRFRDRAVDAEITLFDKNGNRTAIGSRGRVCIIHDAIIETGYVGVISSGNLRILGRVNEFCTIDGVIIDLTILKEELIKASVVEDCAFYSMNSKDIIIYGVFKNNDAVSVRSAGDLTSEIARRSYGIPKDRFVIVPVSGINILSSGEVDYATTEQNKIEIMQSSALVELAGKNTELSSIERKMCEIWKSVLMIDEVGVNDNFFSLGGHSLLLIVLISKMNEAGYSFRARDVIEAETIRELIKLKSKAPNRSIYNFNSKDDGKLYSIPNRQLLYISDFKHHFNISKIFKISDANPQLLEKSLRQTILCHEGLRHKFHFGENGVVYEIVDKQISEKILEVIDFTDCDSKEKQIAAIEAACDEMQFSLKLNERLYRFVLFKIGNNEPDRFLMIVHHALVDGYSVNILLNEVFSRYLSMQQRKIFINPKRATSMREWANCLHYYANLDEQIDSYEYWTSRPWDKVRKMVDFEDGFEKNRTLDKSLYGNDIVCEPKLSQEETEYLLSGQYGAASVTMFEIVCFAFSSMMCEMTGSPYVSFDLTVSGRENLVEGVDLINSIGWFTDYVPYLVHHDSTLNIESALRSFQQQSRGISKYGLSFGALKHLSDNEDVRNKLSKIERPEFTINYIPPGPVTVTKAGAKDNLNWESIAPSKESVGRLMAPGLKEIIWHGYIEIRVKKNCLHFMWICRDNIYKKTTVETALSRWLDEISRIINHLKQQSSC
jgi:hypothetical protein